MEGKESEEEERQKKEKTHFVTYKSQVTFCLSTEITFSYSFKCIFIFLSGLEELFRILKRCLDTPQYLNN